MSVTITPSTAPSGARSRVQASTMLLSEWLALFRPNTTHLWNLRLGPTVQSVPGVTLTPAIEGMLRRFNLYADCVSVSPTEIEVIESKVVAEPGAISQVETYAQLALTTPALTGFTGRAVVPVLLFATNSDIVRQKAVAAGIRYQIYSPVWIQEYLASKYYRLNRS
jgi:hypothetical protein